MGVKRRGGVSSSEHAVNRIREENLTLPTRPEDEVPKLPRDITDLSDEALMELFVVLSSWLSYLETKCAMAISDEKQSEANLKLEEATSLVDNWIDSKDKVTIANAKRSVSEDVVNLRQDLLNKVAYRRLMETLAGNVNRDHTVVSRDLSRRIGGRGENLNNRAARWRT